MIIQYLKKSDHPKFSSPYSSLAIISVWEMLNLFIPDTDQQVPFLESVVQSFYREFSDGKQLKIEMDAKYRQLKDEVKLLLNDGHYYRKLGLDIQYSLFLQSIKRISIKSIDTNRKRQLLADLIHMHINRIFVDEQRKHELVIYYCLFKYSVSTKAMTKK